MVCSFVGSNLTIFTADETVAVTNGVSGTLSIASNVNTNSFALFSDRVCKGVKRACPVAASKSTCVPVTHFVVTYAPLSISK